MSLTLRSDLPEVEAYLREIDKDRIVGKKEFKDLRDLADSRLNALTSIDAKSFQTHADTLVDSLRLLAVKARDDESFKDQRPALRTAMEFQIAYVVAGYQWAEAQFVPHPADASPDPVKQPSGARTSNDAQSGRRPAGTATDHVRLSSSDDALNHALRQTDLDGETSAIELQRLKDTADDVLFDALGILRGDDEKEKAFRRALMRFVSSADEMVEVIQRIALQARRQKLDSSVRSDLRSFAEHQVAYLIGGYNASFQRP